MHRLSAFWTFPVHAMHGIVSGTDLAQPSMPTRKACVLARTFHADHTMRCHIISRTCAARDCGCVFHDRHGDLRTCAARDYGCVFYDRRSGPLVPASPDDPTRECCQGSCICCRMGRPRCWPRRAAHHRTSSHRTATATITISMTSREIRCAYWTILAMTSVVLAVATTIPLFTEVGILSSTPRAYCHCQGTTATADQDLGCLNRRGYDDLMFSMLKTVPWRLSPQAKRYTQAVVTAREPREPL